MTQVKEVLRGNPALDVQSLVTDPKIKIIVCCGAGGVGKTTTAAALALRAAEAGRSVVVLTIDPARRLAQSMGLAHLDNTPRTVPGVGPGTLDAMMLDMKRTFDDIVIAHADPDRASDILNNPFYEALSTSFAGTQEYMAMEKLGQLHRESEASGRWDLIVVDTPPSRSALDFLDAPKRMGRFLEGRFMRILVAPAKMGGKAYMRLLTAGLGVFTNVLQRILGAAFLSDLQAFVAAFEAVFSDWRSRADQTFALLADPATSFLVVAAPEPDALREASFFIDRLHSEHMPLSGLILNRVVSARLPELSAEQAAAGAERLRDLAAESAPAADDAEATSQRLTAALLDLHSKRMKSMNHQAHLARRFTQAHPGVAVAPVPALAWDVHDLDGLREIGEHLTTGDQH